MLKGEGVLLHSPSLMLSNRLPPFFFGYVLYKDINPEITIQVLFPFMFMREEEVRVLVGF